MQIYVVVERTDDWTSALAAFKDLKEAEALVQKQQQDFVDSINKDDYVWVDTIELFE